MQPINRRKEVIMLSMLSTLATFVMLSAPAAPAATTPASSAATPANPVAAPPQNNAPRLTEAMTDRELQVGGDSTTVDLSKHFSDADGHALSYTVSSSDTAAATASVSGHTLTIAPVAAGTTTITVTAQDPGKSKATGTFKATVFAKGPWSISPEGNVYRLTGNVGIGTSKPDQRLVVDGRVRAEEIHIENVTPADHVFDPDYPLMPLEDLQRYLRIRKHLPGIRPGAEMESEGIDLGRMQTRLLEKIEELVLYTIAQHKRIESQRRIIASQRRLMDAQDRCVEALAKRLAKLEGRN